MVLNLITYVQAIGNAVVINSPIAGTFREKPFNVTEILFSAHSQHPDSWHHKRQQ